MVEVEATVVVEGVVGLVPTPSHTMPEGLLTQYVAPSWTKVALHRIKQDIMGM